MSYYLSDKVEKLNNGQISFVCTVVNRFGKDIDGMGGPYCDKDTLKYFATEFVNDCLKNFASSPLATDKGVKEVKNILNLIGE